MSLQSLSSDSSVKSLWLDFKLQNQDCLIRQGHDTKARDYIEGNHVQRYDDNDAHTLNLLIVIVIFIIRNKSKSKNARLPRKNLRRIFISLREVSKTIYT